jgi:hypothetical protein
MFHRRMTLPLAGAVVLCLAQAGNASAATLSYEETAAGITGSGVGTTYSQLPVVDMYGNRLGPSPGMLAGAPGFSFYDDYIFTVAAATVDSVTSEINLGSLSINNLEERIYSISGNSPPVLGNPTGFQTAWTTPVSFSAGASSGMLTVLDPTTLSAGTYVLEVRGNVTGSNGGGYSGQIDLQPVPLPAALPLLLSGLGLLGGAARKKFARS